MNIQFIPPEKRYEWPASLNRKVVLFKDEAASPSGIFVTIGGQVLLNERGKPVDLFEEFQGRRAEDVRNHFVRVARNFERFFP